MKFLKAVFSTALLLMATACGTNQAPLMNYGMGLNNNGLPFPNNNGGGGTQTSGISGGTRETTWILYGVVRTAADKKFPVSHSVEPMDQVKWYVPVNVQGQVYAQGAFGGAYLTMTQFKVMLNGAQLGTTSSMQGAETVNQAGTLTLSFDSGGIGSSWFGSVASYMVNFPSYMNMGVVINRCKNTAGQPMQCPLSP